MSEETSRTQAPQTVSEWVDLLGKLTHVRLDPPNDSHDVSMFPVEDGKVNGPCTTLTPFQAVEGHVARDALVTAVNFTPPTFPCEVDGKWEYARDVLFPYGHLDLTVRIFLDGPIALQEPEVAKT